MKEARKQIEERLLAREGGLTSKVSTLQERDKRQG